MADSAAETYNATDGAPEYTAAEWRKIHAGMFAGPSATRVYSGVIGGSVSLVGTAITIAPLTAVLEGQSVPTTQGPYWGALFPGDAQLSKTLTAAHATLNRTDAVWLRQFDPEAVPGESPNHGMVIEYVTGTPGAGTPAAPTPPAGSTTYLLATIFVPLNNTPGSVVTQSTAKRSYWMQTATPAAKTRGGGQNVTHAAAANMDLTSTAYDTDGMVNLTSNAIVIVTPGIYRVEASVMWAATNLTGYRTISIALNGTDVRRNTWDAASAFGVTTEQQVCLEMDLPAGASITARLLQTSGVTLATQATYTDSTGLSCTYVRPRP